MKDMILQEAAAIQEELVAYRRQLHENPEVGMDLPNTAAFVEGKLKEFGYDNVKRVAETGVTALVGGKKPGKVILLRADMDALPITEEADEPFKATNGMMHACGHDFHTTMLLGAAKLLKQHEDELDGTVKFMFQPGEEILAGAKAMVADGILENPKVDAAVMFHVAAGMPIPAGTVIIPDEGAFSSASDWFTINIKGKGGHGAMPEKAVDPLLVAANTHIALQAIRSREIASGANAVVTVGQMHGGTTSNVIPDTAMMEGTIRTYDKEDRELILKRVVEIAEGIAKTYRATADAKIIEGCPSVVIDKKVSDDVREALTDLFGAQKVPPAEMLGMGKMSGSEDFSFVTEHVPGLMMMISAGSIEEGYEYSMHHPKAHFNEDVLSKGAAAYAYLAYAWLQKNK